MKSIWLSLVLIGTLASAQVNAADSDIHITWLGGPSMLISYNGFTILTDPMLGSGKQSFVMADPNEMFDLNVGPNTTYFERFAPPAEVDLSRVNAVLLSHAHEDHFDQAAQKQLPKHLPVYHPKSDTDKITQLGFKQSTPLLPGDKKTWALNNATITIEATPADHSDNVKLQPLLGNGLGYYMTFEANNEQVTLYWTGDTLPTKNVMSYLSDLGKPDVLIPNMGRVGTTGPLGQISLGAQDVVHMANTLEAGSVLPIHHSTYDLYLEPIYKLVEQAQGQPWSLNTIAEGSTLIVH